MCCAIRIKVRQAKRAESIPFLRLWAIHCTFPPLMTLIETEISIDDLNFLCCSSQNSPITDSSLDNSEAAIDEREGADQLGSLPLAEPNMHHRRRSSIIGKTSLMESAQTAVGRNSYAEALSKQAHLSEKVWNMDQIHVSASLSCMEVACRGTCLHASKSYSKDSLSRYWCIETPRILQSLVSWNASKPPEHQRTWGPQSARCGQYVWSGQHFISRYCLSVPSILSSYLQLCGLVSNWCGIFHLDHP